MLEKIKSVLFSKYTWMIVGGLIAAAIIWFLSPYFGIGNSYPFQDVFVRIVLIVWLILLVTFACVGWPISPLLFLLAAVAFWYITPTLAFSEYRPFEPVWVRTLCMIVLVVLYAIYVLAMFVRALRRDPDFAEKILRSKSPMIDQEKKIEQKILGLLRPVERRLKNLMTRMKFFRRIFTARDAYLYHLPWYMVLGTPASGKTSLIANARLHFPIPEQTALAATYTSLQSEPAKTDLCNFWLTNDVFLVDTSGSFIQPKIDPLVETKWNLLLNVLRKVRTKHGVNGVVVTISAEELIRYNESQLKTLTALLRTRLSQVRKSLGIVFPVYVYITKMDVLPGFDAYFRSLTTETRDQVFGFTLPYRASAPAQFHQTFVQQELQNLLDRIDRGLMTKLNEELELSSRQELALFPVEFAGFKQLAENFVTELFLDNQFEHEKEKEFLRGLYFVSAAQSTHRVTAIDGGIVEQFTETDASFADAKSLELTANRSFFIHDVFHKVMLPESGLVRPNVKWELKSKFMKAAICTGLFAVLLWVSFGMYYSNQYNINYLESVAHKTEDFRGYVSSYVETPKIEKVPFVLNTASDLASYVGWDMENPEWRVRYGLYAAPSVIRAARVTYDVLLDNLLLTHLIHEVEVDLQKSIQNKDFQAVGKSLSVYLMLHDKTNTNYDAPFIRDWILNIWEDSELLTKFGNNPSMYKHVKQLFDGSRFVKSPGVMNENLVAEARKFLGQQTLPVRLLERMEVIMKPDLPEDFTLIQVVGPQAGLIFKRVSGESIEEGVPGLYTYAGYHTVFNKHLDKYVEKAVFNDGWLMGVSLKDTAAVKAHVKGISTEVRKMYLVRYAEHWKNFLADINVVTGSSLAFDLNVLREFAGPGSPLNRLAPLLVQQVTLSKPIDVAGLIPNNIPNAGKLEKAGNVAQALENYVFREEEKMERDIVDNQFVALREMITGAIDTKNTDAKASAAASGLNLTYFGTLLNEYYNYLAMTNTQINTGALPEDNDINVRMLLEASKMPAPFSTILVSFVEQGAEKVTLSKGEILQKYAEVQMKDLMSSLNTGVTEVCDVAISGRYPFAESKYEVSIDDFNKLFSASGVLETYFNTRLAKFVNTSQRPWQYKSPEQIALEDKTTSPTGAPSSNGVAVAASQNLSFSPTVNSELGKLLSEHGPDPELFARAKDIQKAFFQEPGAQKMALQLNYRIVEVDSTILELILNFDGQSRRYVHEATKDVAFTWPGNISGTHVELIARPLIRMDTSMLRREGAWALFRLIEAGTTISGVNADRKSVAFEFDGRKAIIDFGTNATVSPFTFDNLRKFSCPRMH